MKKKFIIILSVILLIIPLSIKAESTPEEKPVVFLYSANELKQFFENYGANVTLVNDTITFNSDAQFNRNENGTVLSSNGTEYNVKIDLNGHKISGLREISVIGNDKPINLEIIGTKSESQMEGTVIICRQHCNLTIKGGKYSTDNDSIFYFDETGTGNITSSSVNSTDTLVSPIRLYGTSKVTITNLNVYSANSSFLVDGNSTLKIYGGNYTSINNNALYGSGNTTIELNSGTLTSIKSSPVLLYGNSDLKIRFAMLNTNAADYAIINTFGNSKLLLDNANIKNNNVAMVFNGNSTITINSGIYKSTKAQAIRVNDNSKLEIKGGQFESESEKYAAISTRGNSKTYIGGNVAFLSNAESVISQNSTYVEISSGTYINHDSSKYLFRSIGSSNIKIIGGTLEPAKNQIITAEESSLFSVENVNIYSYGEPVYTSLDQGKIIIGKNILFQDLTKNEETNNTKENETNSSKTNKEKSSETVDNSKKSEEKNKTKDTNETKENPDTGTFLGIELLALIAGGAGFIYYEKKNKKFIKL